MNLATNLKYLRKKNGKTQDALSSELNIGRTTLANYEAGISEPNVETLCTIAKYFGIPVDALLSNNVEDALKATQLNNVVPVANGFIGDKYNGMPRIITVDQA